MAPHGRRRGHSDILVGSKIYHSSTEVDAATIRVLMDSGCESTRRRARVTVGLVFESRMHPACALATAVEAVLCESGQQHTSSQHQLRQATSSVYPSDTFCATSCVRTGKELVRAVTSSTFASRSAFRAVSIGPHCLGPCLRRRGLREPDLGAQHVPLTAGCALSLATTQPQATELSCCQLFLSVCRTWGLAHVTCRSEQGGGFRGR